MALQIRSNLHEVHGVAFLQYQQLLCLILPLLFILMAQTMYTGLTIYLTMASPSAGLKPDCYCASYKIKSSMQLDTYLRVSACELTF